MAGITGPFGLEYWASAFLGKLWLKRHLVDHDDAWSVLLGGPVAEDLAMVGGPGAKAALMGLSRLDPTVFGRMCADLAAELGHVPLPDWFERVGEAGVTRAAWAHKIDADSDDGELVLLGIDRRGHEDYSLLIGLEAEATGVATHLVTTWGFDVALETLTHRAEEQNLRFPVKRAEPAFICRRAEAAMRRTDQLPTPRTEETYARERALALTYLRKAIGAPPKRGGLLEQ